MHDARHEVSDANPKLIAIAVAGLFSTILLIMLAIRWTLPAMEAGAVLPPISAAQQSFQNAPDAKTNIERNWLKINQATKEHLKTYRWVNQAQGVIGIPIARAMELIAHEGLPARPTQPPNFPAPDQEMRPLSQTSSSDDVSKSF